MPKMFDKLPHSVENIPSKDGASKEPTIEGALSNIKLIISYAIDEDKKNIETQIGIYMRKQESVF